MTQDKTIHPDSREIEYHKSFRDEAKELLDKISPWPWDEIGGGVISEGSFWIASTVNMDCNKFDKGFISKSPELIFQYETLVQELEKENKILKRENGFVGYVGGALAVEGKAVVKIKKLESQLLKAEEVIRFYLDEDGGPYAAGDYHTADGGEKAHQYFKDKEGK